MFITIYYKYDWCHDKIVSEQNTLVDRKGKLLTLSQLGKTNNILAEWTHVYVTFALFCMPSHE